MDGNLLEQTLLWNGILCFAEIRVVFFSWPEKVFFAYSSSTTNSSLINVTMMWFQIRPTALGATVCREMFPWCDICDVIEV